jgi:hypothetical protein
MSGALGCNSGGARGGPSQSMFAVGGPSGVTLDARLLLVAVDGREPALAAMRAELDTMGTPYAVVTTSGGAVTAAALSDGPGHGLYDGIVLVACGAGAGPDAASVAALDAYAAGFGVRSACLFARADPAFGLGVGTSVDTGAAPLGLQITPAGNDVFGWYTAATAPVVVSRVAAMLSPATDAATTPLLTDDAGDAAVAVHRFADGRELLFLTFDQAPGLAHSSQLLCGVASWLSHGVFIGEKRAYFSAQPDDLFLGTIMDDGTLFRMSGDELRGAARWQQGVRSTAIGAGLRINFPFNGAEVNDSDGLTQAAREVGPQFLFVSHTLDHHRLDYASYDRMTAELTGNDAVMQKYAFGPFDRSSLVTPDISGLANAAVLQSALAFGVVRVVCDSSQPSCRGPVPNTGLQNPVAPTLFMIPRIATNLYANVSTPDEWIAHYNALNRATWGRDLPYGEIIEHESDNLLVHLLAGDIDPVMFHQANLRAYDGAHTLLTDLVDRLIAKYAALRVLPIVSLPMDEMGARMQDRAARDGAGVSGTIRPGQSITVRAAQAARVPVTGGGSADAELYGAVTISRVQIAAGGEVTLPLAGAWVAGADGATAIGAADAGVAIGTSGSGIGAMGTAGCACALAGGERAPAGESPLTWLAVVAAATVAAASRSRPGRRERAPLTFAAHRRQDEHDHGHHGVVPVGDGVVAAHQDGEREQPEAEGQRHPARPFVPDRQRAEVKQARPHDGVVEPIGWGVRPCVAGEEHPGCQNHDRDALPHRPGSSLEPMYPSVGGQAIHGSAARRRGEVELVLGDAASNDQRSMERIP